MIPSSADESGHALFSIPIIDLKAPKRFQPGDVIVHSSASQVGVLLFDMVQINSHPFLAIDVLPMFSAAIGKIFQDDGGRFAECHVLLHDRGH